MNQVSATIRDARAPLSIAMMIETDSLGGAEIVMFQLAEELRGMGHTVIPIGPDHRDRAPQPSSGWLSAKFIEAGYEWHTFRIRKPIDWRCAREMGAMLRSLAVDVVHSHEFTMAVYGTVATKLAGLPHVITMHGNQTMTARLRRRVALRWAFRNSHAVIAVSQATRRHLEETLGVGPETVSVVRNGVPPSADGDRAGVRSELGLGQSDLLVIAVGSLIKRKGHRMLIEALDDIHRGGDAPPWHLAIAGVGPEDGALRSLVAERRLGGRVHMLGPRDDIPDLQAAADIFAMPSLWEGLPLALLEAMSAGNAIVASDVAGIPEAADDQVHALLLRPGDQAALVTALRRLLRDSELRRRLGAAARARWEAEFSIAAMADAYLRYYDPGVVGK